MLAYTICLHKLPMHLKLVSKHKIPQNAQSEKIKRLLTHASTARQLSFEWSDTDKLKREIHLIQHNKQYHMKVLLSGFHLNGHTPGFCPQT